MQAPFIALLITPRKSLYEKKFRQIHLWLSVPFGIIISILCLSGAALVFENEITEALNHDFYYVENVGSTPLPAGELAKR